MARLNSSCAAALHETGKSTFPSFSGGVPRGVSFSPCPHAPEAPAPTGRRKSATLGARQPEAEPQRPMAWTAEANAGESPLRNIAKLLQADDHQEGGHEQTTSRTYLGLFSIGSG